MTGYKLLHPGMTRYHHVGLIVPLVVAVLPYYLRDTFARTSLSQVSKAMLLGAITTALAYVAFTFIPFLQEESYTLNKAVLLGLLTAEVCIFSLPDKIPSIVLIVFFVFMYYFGIAEVE